jgi:hypothetical protein
MAVAVEVTFKGAGATLENYFKSLKILGAVPEGPHPDEDCLFHWITETGDGLRVIDVWTSRPEFEAFVPKVGAAADELGMPKPDVKYIDVANYLTAGS